MWFRKSSRFILLLALSLLLTETSGRSKKEHKHNKGSHHHHTTKATPTPRAITEAAEEYKEEEGKSCSDWWCGLGQECKLGSDSLPSCVCRQQCAENGKEGGGGDEWDFEEEKGPVCGSDGILYPSECELHRTACLTSNTFLHWDNQPGACKEGGRAEGKEEGGDYDDLDNNEENDDDEGFKKKPKDLPTPNNHDDEGSFEEPRDEQYDYMGDENYSAEEDGGKCLKCSKSPSKQSSTTTIKPKTNKRGSTLCTLEEYQVFKDAILVYNHEQLVLAQGKSARLSNVEISPGDSNSLFLDSSIKVDKSQLISLIFAHFDHNHDGQLGYKELQQMGLDEKMGRSQLRCHPLDFLRYDDMNQDVMISPQEFAAAFNNLYSMKVVTALKPEEEYPGAEPQDEIQLTGKVGQRLEIGCTLSGVTSWFRYGHPVDFSSTLGLLGRSGALLVIPQVRPLHGGNFSCKVGTTEQPYHLTVISEPETRVEPHMVVWERPGGSISLECLVRGEPFPEVRWMKNEVPLQLEELQSKYSVEGPTLTIRDIHVADTGAYMCEASNDAGTRMDIASLVVMEDLVIPYVGQQERNESHFVLLHEGGISAYDPTNCEVSHQILPTDIIPGTQQDYVCGPSPTCEWGSGVRVSSSYIYASQPSLHRVLVISISEMLVVGVINTLPFPNALHYVPHVDQVWVECGWGDEKTLQVVKNAKEKRRHKASHLSKIWDNLVRSLFLPSEDLDSSSSDQFDYAYFTRNGARGLYKVDLRTLRYVKSVDLSVYNCLPEKLHFSSLYGFLIIECREPVLGRATGQLVLDLLSDSVILHNPHHNGKSFLSPDSRKLVTLLSQTKISLQLLTQNGLEVQSTVSSLVNVSDVTFFPSQRFHSYDLYATSLYDDRVLFLDLNDESMQVVPGTGQPPIISTRPIVAQRGGFGHYLVTPGGKNAYVLNGRSHTVNCQVGILHRVSSILWLEK